MGDDSDDDFEYAEVEVEEEDADLDAEDDVMLEDLNTAMRSLQALGRGGAQHGGQGDAPRQAYPGQVTKQPEVIDDFIRNFFVKVYFQ
jgi:hypothetical protein